jgi:hypothetical protein
MLFQLLKYDVFSDGAVQQIHRHVLDDSEVPRCLIRSHPSVIIAEGDVGDPVQSVFNAPMRADGASIYWRFAGQGGDEVSGLSRDFPVDVAMRGHPPCRPQSSPVRVTLDQPVDLIANPVFTGLNAPLSAVNGLKA